MTEAELRKLRRASERSIEILEQAREDSIAVWDHLSEHGEIDRKPALPKLLYKKIEFDRAECPLCSIFMPYGCDGCPLKKFASSSSIYKYPCVEPGHPFSTWSNAIDSDRRALAEKLIADAIRAWIIA